MGKLREPANRVNTIFQQSKVAETQQFVSPNRHFAQILQSSIKVFSKFPEGVSGVSPLSQISRRLRIAKLVEGLSI